MARVQLSSCSNAKLKEHANYFPHSTENHSNTTVQLSYQENDHNLLTNSMVDHSLENVECFDQEW